MFCTNPPNITKKTTFYLDRTWHRKLSWMFDKHSRTGVLRPFIGNCLTKIWTKFPTQSYHCELPVATGEQTSFFWFNLVFAAMLCLIIGPTYLPSFLAWEYKKHWESGIFANLRYWYPWMLFFPGIGSTTGPSRDWGRGYQYLYIS